MIWFSGLMRRLGLQRHGECVGFGTIGSAEGFHAVEVAHCWCWRGLQVTPTFSAPLEFLDEHVRVFVGR